MSFALEFAPEAKLQLRQLELWLQEETLDLIDDAAANPTLFLGWRGNRHSTVIDIRKDREGIAHYVFVTVKPDFDAQILIVRMIATYVSPVEDDET